MGRQTSNASLPKVGGKSTGSRKAPGGNPCKGGNTRGGIVGQTIHRFKKTSNKGENPSRAFGNNWGSGGGGAKSGARSAGPGGFSAH